MRPAFRHETCNPAGGAGRVGAEPATRWCVGDELRWRVSRVIERVGHNGCWVRSPPLGDLRCTLPERFWFQQPRARQCWCGQDLAAPDGHRILRRHGTQTGLDMRRPRRPESIQEGPRAAFFSGVPGKRSSPPAKVRPSLGMPAATWRQSRPPLGRAASASWPRQLVAAARSPARARWTKTSVCRIALPASATRVTSSPAMPRRRSLPCCLTHTWLNQRAAPSVEGSFQLVANAESVLFALPRRSEGEVRWPL